MAVHGVKTAHEAKIVAAELERISTNGVMLVLMMSIDPQMKDKVGLLAQFLKGLSDFANDLRNAADGVGDEDEVFTTTDMDLKYVEGMGALEKLVGGLTP